MGKIVIVAAAEVVIAVYVGVLGDVPAVVVVAGTVAVVAAASGAALDLSFSDQGTAPAASVQPARNKRSNLPSFPPTKSTRELFVFLDLSK